MQGAPDRTGRDARLSEETLPIRLPHSLRARIPASGDLLSVLGLVVFVVHSWSVRSLLFHVPYFILKLTAGEVLAVASYHMVFALLESTLVMALLTLLAAVLPAAWLRDGFVHKGFLVIIAAGLAAVFLQQSFFYGAFAFDHPNQVALYWRAALGVVLFSGAWLLVDRSRRLQAGIGSLVERFSVMLLIYLPLDLVGLLVLAPRLVR